MKQDPTTLLDVAPALVAGGVGLLSALLSYLMARYQIRQLQEEQQANRTFQLRTTSLGRRHDSLEAVWGLLWSLEEAGALTELEVAELVRCSVWLPTSIRDMAIGVVSKASRSEAVVPQEIAEIRRSIVSAVSALEDSA